MSAMSGETMDGRGYRVNVIRGVTFRDYDTAGMESCEASVEEGVITLRNIQDELTVWQARSWAALLLAAADELEGQGNFL